jgi:hypothetical protein
MPSLRWPKGQSGNPAGPKPTPPSQRLSQMVIYDLKQAARRHTEEAVAVIAKCLHDEDPKIRLTAATILLERGCGKPEVVADVNINHNFVVAPEVMTEKDWEAAYCSGVAQRPEPPKMLDLKVEKAPDGKLN